MGPLAVVVVGELEPALTGKPNSHRQQRGVQVLSKKETVPHLLPSGPKESVGLVPLFHWSLGRA